MSRGLTSPLLQFVVAGAAIYAAVSFFGREAAPVGREGSRDDRTDHTIVIERDALLDFVQLRTGEPDAEANARGFDALSPEAKQLWRDRYVRDEALVREARRLGLDRGDDLIRRRLVQKMEFLAEGDVGEKEAVTPAELAAYYEAFADRYREPAILTFAHVFVRDADARGEGDEASRARAETLVAELNAGAVPFDGAGARGDRFLYNRRYVERSLAEVVSHFGAGFGERLVGIEVEPVAWQGPLASEHGWHAVLLSERRNARQPDLAELESMLRRDLMREKRTAAVDGQLESIIDRYEIIELDAGAP